eukprot:CFRG7053T1
MSEPSSPEMSGADFTSIPDMPASGTNRGEEGQYADEANDFLEEQEEQENAGISDEGEGEDLLDENMFRDYRASRANDQYEQDMIDDSEHSEMSIGERRAVENDLRKRDRLQGRRPAALDEESDEDESRRRRRRRVADFGTDEFGMDMDEEREAVVSLEDRGGKPLREFLTLDAVQKEISRLFRIFLTQYKEAEGKPPVYAEVINHMCTHNKTSLEVDYKHLCLWPDTAIIAIYLADGPIEMLKIFDSVALEVVLRGFPDYGSIHEGIHVRISGLPVDEPIRDIRHNHLNAFLKTTGVVTRRTGILPQLTMVKFDCVKCKSILGPYAMDFETKKDFKVGSCPECQSKGPFPINTEETVYRNYQRITLQESPGSVPPGRLPRHKIVILTFDLVDSCKPGDEISVTGVYRNQYDSHSNKKNGFPVFTTVIEANHVLKAELGMQGLTEDDVNSCKKLAKDSRIAEKIFNSIAPSIYGHTDIKMALALAMFGGEAKENPNKKHRVRGDINILILGDPGCAKSQFLKYVEKTAPRVVYTTGQGASAVGLTASVHKDPVTREWTLEGGALVLADKGMCLIDEFDKMNDQDRTSIHEAMEQQSISISKAGIVTSLQARCSVVAAANPRTNVYDPTRTFSQNVDLTEPILSRFDILCVVQDKIERENDTRLAKFVTRSHVLNHPANRTQLEEMAKEKETNEVNEDKVPQDLLRKFIRYAKANVRPKLQNVDVDKITSVYAELRREAMIHNSIPITVRHLESMLRMSEAHARMHLREYVHEEDVNLAIRCMLDSFISTQKHSVVEPLRRSLTKYLTFKRDYNDLLIHTLNDVWKEHANYVFARRGEMPSVVEIDIEDFEVQARKLNVQDLSVFYSSKIFSNSGYTYDKQKRIIVKNTV